MRKSFLKKCLLFDLQANIFLMMNLNSNRQGANLSITLGEDTPKIDNMQILNEDIYSDDDDDDFSLTDFKTPKFVDVTLNSFPLTTKISPTLASMLKFPFSSV